MKKGEESLFRGRNLTPNCNMRDVSRIIDGQIRSNKHSTGGEGGRLACLPQEPFL